MHPFTLVFLVAVALGVGIQEWLLQRQVRSVRAHREEVPLAFRERIPLEAHHKAADYTVAKAGLHRLELILAAVVLLGWTVGGGLEALDEAWRGLAWGPVATGVGFLLSVLLLSAVIDLPLSAYSDFVIEARFGFNRSTPKMFVVDTLKQVLLTLVLGTPLVALVLWLMDSAGRWWWVYVWAVWTAFGLLMMWAYPALIAPLFNKFSPLKDESLRERIQALLERCGFTSNGIFVMDGSKRSSHGNAYFTGVGRQKRIVFFDTLIDSLQPQEIEAVLAHELGHFKLRHVRKQLITMTVISLGGLALLGWLVDQAWFYTGLGLSRPSLHGALVLFLLAMPVFTLFLQPIQARISRRHEFEADDFAASQADPGDLRRALVKMYEENASTLTPDPVYSAFYDSHPPAPVRAAYLSELEHRRQP